MCLLCRCSFFFIVNVRRCEDRATYNPDAEQAADEVPIVLENNFNDVAAGQAWCGRLKRHREAVQAGSA